MKTIQLTQGSSEWHKHRATHFNASDAPAMLGCSPFETRTQLMTRLKTCVSADVDPATQRRFDDGHRFEALARPLAEKIISEDLYPQVGTKGKLSASFDGLTMDEATNWEHKTLNAELANIMVDGFSGADLPKYHRVQMEHQRAVAQNGQTLFMASKWDSEGNLLDMRHCWYPHDDALLEEVLAGWEQFEIDLADFVPPVAAPVLVAAAQETLPAVSVQLNGSIAIIDNLDVFSVALTAYIEKINKEPQTDQDFVNLKSVVATLEKAEAALDAAEGSALASIASVNTMQSAIGTLRTLTKQNRLMCEKIYKAENDRRKLEIVQGGKDAFAAHIASLNERLGKNYMPAIAADFVGVARNLRTLASLQNAIDTELARVKIEASAVADKVQANLTVLRETAKDYPFLFADTSTIVLKACDDFKTLVESRIAAHQVAEAAKLEQERERIRAEEVARIENLAKAEALAAAKVVELAVAESAKATALAAEETTKAATASSLQILDVREKLLSTQKPVQQPDVKTDPVIEAQPVIAEFMASRSWGNDFNKVRAILVEFEKFKALVVA